MNTQLRSFLDLSRWFAAFLVLATHVRHLLLVDYSFVKNKTLFLKGLYFISGFGHEAVVIFFVISGFLVGGITLERWRSQGPDLASYASARVSRIYTVLIPALLLGLALDWIGLHWYNSSELYTNSDQYKTISMASVITKDLNIRTFIGNLFHLQGILTGHFGSNVPLWSLAYEWWYYCIFALLAAALTKNAGSIRLLYLAIALVLCYILPLRLVMWGLIWLLGIVAFLWMRSTIWKPPAWLGIPIFLATCIYVRMSHNVDQVNIDSLRTVFINDLTIGLTFILALVSASRLKVHIPFASLHKRLADFSFSTYLFHFPLLVFIVAVCYQRFGIKFQVQPSAVSLVYLTSVTVGLYVYCYMLSFCTEKHTEKIKVWIHKKMIEKRSTIREALKTHT